jgi:hypothetical protein
VRTTARHPSLAEGAGLSFGGDLGETLAEAVDASEVGALSALLDDQ